MSSAARYAWFLFVWMLLGASRSYAAPVSAADYQDLIEGSQQPDRGGFDALTLQQLMQRLRVPGASIAVIKDFKIHWAKGYGIADVETGTKVDTDTLFQAGSISKPLAAMALLKAAQDGKLSLDDDINSLLHSWKLAGGDFTKDRPVTPRSLVSHTSGLGDGFGFPGYSPADAVPSLQQILDGQPPSNVGMVVMERPPLQAIKYSGGGYVVLQLAMVERLQQPFTQIMRSLVLDPIGMSSSSFEQPLSAARDRKAARGHDNRGKSMGDKWHVYPELAAAGLWTHPTDLARFVIEIQQSLYGKSNRVLSAASVRDMLSPVGVGDFGVGIELEKRGQGWYFKHRGVNWGFINLLHAHKLKGYGVVVMTNSFSDPFTNEVRDRVERAYNWDALDKAPVR